MYNVSEKYKTAIGQSSRITKIEGTLTLPDGTVINITDNDIMSGTLNIDNACVNGQEFEIGSVYMGQLKFSLNTQISRYAVYYSKIKLSFFLKIDETGDDDADWEEVPLGEYSVCDAMRNGKYISITAYDNMTKFDKDFKMLTNGNAFELLNYICEACEMELGMTEEEIYNLSPISNEGDMINLSVKENNNYETFRDFLSDIAITLGGFATIDRSGKLVIKQYCEEPISLSERHIKTKSISDYHKSYSKVTTVIGTKPFEYGDDTGEELKLENNLWDTGTDTTKGHIVEHLSNQINKIKYTPSEIIYGGDPSLDLGDRISFTDVDNKTLIYSYVMTNNWTYRNTQKIASVGSNPFFKNVKSKESKQAASAGQLAEQKSIKFTNYQSATRYEIKQHEQLICQLKINVSETGTLLITGQLILNITKPGTFKLLYEVNSQVFPFQPMQITTTTGPHLINLSFPLTSLNPAIENLLNIYLTSPDGGEGVINESDVMITLLGSITSTDNKFDGNINLNEKFTITEMTINNGLKLKYSSHIDIIKQDLFDFQINMPLLTTSGSNICGWEYDIESTIEIAPEPEEE
jgi:hypothetical protein